MPLVARYPLSFAAVLAALTATAGIFLFARPQYHPKGEGSVVKLDLSKYPPAADGWVWKNGQPGFRFGEYEDAWNPSQVKPAELAPIRAVARRNGIAPASLRVIDAIRLDRRGDLSIVVAGTNAADETCLGFATPSRTSFYCPPRLGPQSAFVLVTTRDPFVFKSETVHPTFLTGIVRGDVTRVVVNQPEDWPNARIYAREPGSPWGTFTLSISSGRDVDLTVYRETGVSRTVHVDESAPGDRIVAIGD